MTDRRTTGTRPAMSPAITRDMAEDALGRCLVCGGRLADGDDTVHAWAADCERILAKVEEHGPDAALFSVGKGAGAAT